MALSASDRSDNLASIERFYAQLPVVSIRRGNHIFVENEIPRVAYAVKSGIVRSYFFTNDFQERSLSFVIRNELLPIGWLFSKTTTAYFNYVAHTDCELYRVDKTMFHSLLKGDGDLAYRLLSHSVSDYVSKVLQISSLEQSYANLKVLYCFKHFCLQHGKPLLKGQSRIMIPLTQKDIAGFTGLTRETVTIEVQKLKKKGVLSVVGQIYTVDLSKLDAILETNPSSDVSIAQ